ncbi:hypothetical protein ACEQPO_02990 [Bacillus sp. SL00103]
MKQTPWQELNALLEQTTSSQKPCKINISQENAGAIEEITASTDEQVTAISNVAKQKDSMN